MYCCHGEKLKPNDAWLNDLLRKECGEPFKPEAENVGRDSAFDFFSLPRRLRSFLCLSMLCNSIECIVPHEVDIKQKLLALTAALAKSSLERTTFSCHDKLVVVSASSFRDVRNRIKVTRQFATSGGRWNIQVFLPPLTSNKTFIGALL